MAQRDHSWGKEREGEHAEQGAWEAGHSMRVGVRAKPLGNFPSEYVTKRKY